MTNQELKNKVKILSTLLEENIEFIERYWEEADYGETEIDYEKTAENLIKTGVVVIN